MKTAKQKREFRLKPSNFPKQRSYLILAEEIETGTLFGYCEESFSMGYYKDRVRLQRPRYSRIRYGCLFSENDLKQYYRELVGNLQREVKKLNAINPTYRHFIARAGSKNCPVRVNWTEWYETRDKSKFNYRNIGFVCKELAGE